MFMFRFEDGLLLKGCRGFIAFYRNISKHCPTFGLKRFLTNPFSFYYALFTVYCIYFPFVASLNKHQCLEYLFMYECAYFENYILLHCLLHFCFIEVLIFAI